MPVDLKAHKSTIYCMGICGTGMGALAGLLKQLGHTVLGSDAGVYPPMSDKLREWGIVVKKGYTPENLQPRPDLVIVGNVIRADNVEAVYARELGIPMLSMPAAIAQYGIGTRHSVVIAGTHGKTTTTAMAAHMLMHAGYDPSYLVGGALVDYPESFHHGEGKFFVIEGDEYDTAYFDKKPKFLHYRAQTAVISSLEYDHADIFADIQAVEAAFVGLIEAVPEGGHLVVWHGADRARALIAKHAKKSCRVTTYATTPQADANLWMESCYGDPDGLHFTAVYQGVSLGPMHIKLWGDFSACNVLAVLGALQDAQLSTDAWRAGFASFSGVRRRMELVGSKNGVMVVDDFAHHPTAVKVTLQAARTRWPQARLWAVFEPRSATSRRNVFEQQYTEAFALADQVVIASHPRLLEIPEPQRFLPETLVLALQKLGTSAVFIPTTAAILTYLLKETRPGDVVMLLSNGDFGGLAGKLVNQLITY